MILISRKYELKYKQKRSMSSTHSQVIQQKNVHIENSKTKGAK